VTQFLKNLCQCKTNFNEYVHINELYILIYYDNFLSGERFQRSITLTSDHQSGKTGLQKVLRSRYSNIISMLIHLSFKFRFFNVIVNIML